MTSDPEAIKTNEFLRRRKLRLQQVREQSKDIAKKIRQRAKVEKLRQVGDLGAKKQKEYFECQEKLVKQLEVLYARGLENVGSSHRGASEVLQQDEVVKKDLSKLRGREATTELRKKKQEILDQHKKLLDRKLHAREVANEISWEKTLAVNKFLSKSSTTKVTDDPAQEAGSSSELANIKESNKDAEKSNNKLGAVTTSDMATQWDMETMPNEWEPAVPTLVLPSDKDTLKESEVYVGSRTEKNKRLDLFALSNEMPLNLRGKYIPDTKVREPGRPSLTLISEYLQNRKLRLRETETANTKKKAPDDMQSLKQTIQRTRTSKPEGSPLNVCQVLDEQIIPVPAWRAEKNCQICAHSVYYHSPVPSRQFKSVTNSQINQIFSSIRPVQQSGILPSPVMRGKSPFKRSKLDPRISKCPLASDKARNTQENVLPRKSSILMYNHSTRDSRDLPCGDENLVVRDSQSEEDAYSRAMRQSEVLGAKDKEHHKKVQDMRNKVAVTKQNVEKEYKDTMNFLNSLPKDKGGKVIRNAYMDERRQQMQQESHQQKMHNEYRKIEKECRRHLCLNKSQSKSKCSAKHDSDDNFEGRDFQYSWMPVPESDYNFAIHAIPNTVKQGKSGNSVKFSKVDSYHEYRSRHKHTPPTKDTTQDKPCHKKVVEAVIIDKNNSDSSESSSITSDTSSVETLSANKKTKSKNAKEIIPKLSDAERIIIYEVLDARSNKKSKRHTKLLNEIAKSLTCIEKGQETVNKDGEPPNKPHSKHIRSTSKSADHADSLEHLNEGVYEIVEEQGDNVASMYFTDRDNVADAQPDDMQNQSYHCKKRIKDQQTDKCSVLHWESGDGIQPSRSSNESPYPSASEEKVMKPAPTMQSSTVPSTSSFKTANKDKDCASEGGYIKLVDEIGQEAGKFFIGASDFLNNNAYEVVIQLRKKDQENKSDEKTLLNQNKQPDSEINNKSNKNDQPTGSKTDANYVQLTSEENLHESLDYRCRIDEESKMIPSQTLQNNHTNTPVVSEELLVDKNEKYQSETNTEAGHNTRPIQPTSEKKDTSNNVVHTHLTQVPKLDQPPRPATTTYTQTTSSSPIHRPVFFHMSSSTSTAYMSPPEMILPKFFRHDRVMSEDEIFDPIQTIEMTEKEYCEKYTSCTCRKCMHARKVALNKKVPVHCRRHKSESEKLRIPPVSANNLIEARLDAYDVLQERNVDVPYKNARQDKIKCKHNNCENVDHVKKHYHRNKRPSEENIHLHRVGMKLTKRNRYKSTSSSQDKKLRKSSLNPIIRDYVNKLLALNREGLKAVEVGDQECSSVGTPGSSIINVPYNVDERKASIANTISLEQIKNVLKQQILQEQLTKNMNYSKNSVVYSATNSANHLKCSSSRTSRKKPVHKVKSFNISKNLLKKNKNEVNEVTSKKSASSPTTEENFQTPVTPKSAQKLRSNSSPTPRQMYTLKPTYNHSESTSKNSTGTDVSDDYNNRSRMSVTTEPPIGHHQDSTLHCGPQFPLHRATATSLDSNSKRDLQGHRNKSDIPVSMSTQTNQNIDRNADTNFMKLAEDKLLNMEKIADLTEKCTKRLSNLAKVLEEVRKNKSLVYSQISSPETINSQSDQKSDKAVLPLDLNNIPQRLETQSPEPVSDKENTTENETGYITVLKDIAKPIFKIPEPSVVLHPKSDNKLDSPFKIPESSDVLRPKSDNKLDLAFKISEPSDVLRPKSHNKLGSPLHLYADTAELFVKSRPKPPPALSRLNFKHCQEYVIPHELSTVIEVDSPMSMKHKNQSARNDAKETSNNSGSGYNESVDYRKSETIKEATVNPDLLQSNTKVSKNFRFSSTESSDDSKFQMIDLKQFNEIMLEPFISIQEYAKQYNMEPPDEGSNLEDLQKEDAINDDMSSLHSDGSLPDVIAELLKRNIITEPFKFDTASNINSTTISSESTLSMLALSKARRDRKKSGVLFQNKENIGETSDTLSMSSNPDLENAFKKLGMGWASSTLKKTKERLALSSSSNTSSSSLSQFKMKSFNQDIPVLVTDSMSSVINVSNAATQNKNATDNSKNVEQQTTLSNSMTVKEFLRNKLAKKITFNNKSNEAEEEFVSLFETKMPDEMKDTSHANRNERSVDSAPSGGTRARTSTPVQLFKSMTYHSSSSSNVSNGLFSNADDLSSVKMTSNSMKNHSTSDKDDLTIPNFSLRMKNSSDYSKSD